jgi:AraC-like DNA-binding protein
VSSSLSGIAASRRFLNLQVLQILTLYVDAFIIRRVIPHLSLRAGPPLCIAERAAIPPAIARIMAAQAAGGHSRGTRAQQQLVTKAKGYVASRPGERIRLAEVGRDLAVSPVYLTGVFRQVEGVPFYQYVLRTRLERAVRLLPHYAADLSAFALDLGFSSHSHFTATFSSAFGFAPAVFRERARSICTQLRAAA